MKIDVIGLLGLLVSIGGFALALWQLKRTRIAAEAANSAVTEAVRTLKFVNSVVSAQDICGRTRTLLDLARSKNKLKAAASAAFELREQLARLHATEAGRSLSSEQNWNDILEEIGETHDQLESAAMINRIDVTEHQAIIHSISQLHTKFSSIAASNTDFGANNANT